MSAGSISVIICTYNRCESLKDTLKAVSLQAVPHGYSVETIVVDNNSKDATRALVDSLRPEYRWPLIYVFEGQQGLSAARNQGLRHASGELILFTDDDVMPEENWIVETLRGFETLKVDALGGKILPRWEVSPPHWMNEKGQKDAVWGMFALLDRGETAEIAESQKAGLFYGANMSFRKTALDACGSFRTDLGVIGNKRRLDDDTEMLQRLYAAGKKIGYWPKSVVHHKVPKDRMTLSYIRNWRYNKSLSVVRSAGGRPRLSLWLVKECMQHFFSMIFCRLTRKDSSDVHHEMQFWTQLGQIRGILEARLSGSRGKE